MFNKAIKIIYRTSVEYWFFLYFYSILKQFVRNFKILTGIFIISFIAIDLNNPTCHVVVKINQIP